MAELRAWLRDMRYKPQVRGPVNQCAGDCACHLPPSAPHTTTHTRTPITVTRLGEGSCCPRTGSVAGLHSNGGGVLTRRCLFPSPTLPVCGAGGCGTLSVHYKNGARVALVSCVRVGGGRHVQGKYVSVGQPSSEELATLVALCPRMFAWLARSQRHPSRLQVGRVTVCVCVCVASARH